jgi:hypothetical protein
MKARGVDALSVALWWVAGPGDYGQFVFASSHESAVDLFSDLAGLSPLACQAERVREAVGLRVGRPRLASPRELAVLGAREVRLSPEEHLLMMGGRLYKPRLLRMPLAPVVTAVDGVGRARVTP